ncbi:bpX6 domain-containing protein [Variovorax sp. KBW07]|uniref:bpX6 domain-containing protein n=1 Tax=Variovorax sp. KBW07 TaxID=2153358 RepID=UPI000F57DE2F|nr:bpX6 domain-containing protein [Variovorax sp. KBW07]
MRMPEPGQRMPAAQVHRPVLKGRQSVAGLWFSSEWLPEPLRARRIVEAWRVGAQLFRFAEGDLLRFAAPVSLDCDRLAGWPLRREGAALCSAELDRNERAALPMADIWLVQGGEVLALQLSQATPFDVSMWLDAGPALLDTFDCREALPQPVVLDAEGRSVRDVLGDAIPPASDEQLEFLKSMAERARDMEARRGVMKTGAPARRASGPTGWAGSGNVHKWWGWALVALALLAFFLSGGKQAPSSVDLTKPSASRHEPSMQLDASSIGVAIATLLIVALVIWAMTRVEARRARQSKGGRPASKPATSARPAPSPSSPSPSLKPRGNATPLRSRWRDWMARMAIASQLSKLLGRQQAAYMRRMLKMFDDGDLMEALRHAIPLGGEGHDVGQAFGTPGRRDSLSLNGSNGPRSGIYVDDNFQEHLRQLYRKSFEKLDRDGRIDEAVFVLAELLQVRQEALDYLEKHQRHAQAAELALGWDRPSEVIVRLLCLAGDWRRAIAVARRDNAFANAVLQLQAKWPEMANRLREEWGEALAQRGEWLKAVDAVWPVPAAREKAVAWLLAAEAADGRLAARALVQRALLLPDTLDACAERLRALRDDPLLHRERAALASELLAVASHTATSRGLMAVLMPALLADHAGGHGRLDKKAFQALLRLNADPLLQADMPGGEMPGFQARPLVKQPRPLVLDAPAAGAHAVHDAALLDDGRYLLALGEAGAVMTDTTGHVLARFAAPAYRLVPAYSGQVALALAQRDGLWRVSRLDLVQRQIDDLGFAAIDHFVTEFDGIGWTVARGNRIQVLDTGRSLQDVLWQVADLPGEVVELTATRHLEQFVVHDDVLGPSLWRYQCELRRLLSRERMDFSAIPMSKHMLHPQLGAFRLLGETEEGGTLCLRWRVVAGIEGVVRVPDHADAPEGTALGFWVDGDWLVMLRSASGNCTLQWLVLGGGRAAATLAWPDGEPGMRAVANGWLVFDGQGRVLHLDTERSVATGFAIR